VNVGNYIKWVLDEKKVSLKRIHENLTDYFKSQKKEYVTYQRFCNKLSEDNVTAEELLVICNLVDLKIEQLISFAKMEMGGFKMKADEVNVIIQSFREHVNVYHDEEIVSINDEEALSYLSITESKINPSKHEIISVTHIIDHDTNKERKTIHLVGYSFDLNELIFEIIDIDSANKTITSRNFLHSQDLDVLLKTNDLTKEEFELQNIYEKYALIDKIRIDYLSFTSVEKKECVYEMN